MLSISLAFSYLGACFRAPDGRECIAILYQSTVPAVMQVLKTKQNVFTVPQGGETYIESTEPRLALLNYRKLKFYFGRKNFGWAHTEVENIKTVTKTCKNVASSENQQQLEKSEDPVR